MLPQHIWLHAHAGLGCKTSRSGKEGVEFFILFFQKKNKKYTLPWYILQKTKVLKREREREKSLPACGVFFYGFFEVLRVISEFSLATENIFERNIFLAGGDVTMLLLFTFIVSIPHRLVDFSSYKKKWKNSYKYFLLFIFSKFKFHGLTQIVTSCSPGEICRIFKLLSKSTHARNGRNAGWRRYFIDCAPAAGVKVAAPFTSTATTTRRRDSRRVEMCAQEHVCALCVYKILFFYFFGI